MPLSIQSLFNSTKDIYRLKVLAGGQGMTNPVSWMYYTEDASTIDFIRGGELAITTGMSISRHITNTGTDDPKYAGEYLSMLINKLVEQHASGLIINNGHYIQEVPKKVITLCDKLNFPLLSMPWEIHMIDIMQDYGNRIVNDRQKRLTLAQTFYDALFHHENFHLSQLENTSFAGATCFSIILLELPDELFRKDDEELNRYIDYSFNGKLQLQPASFCYLIHDHKIVYVLHEDPRVASEAIAKMCTVDKLFADKHIGVSNVCTSIEDLHKEYAHAELALKFEEKNISYYNNLGIFKLLAEVQDRRVLEQMYDDVLGKLSVFSNDKRADYLKTLRLYLATSGKVQLTAEENSTHRNTINYRIHKIRDILGVDLQDGDVRYLIQTALYIRDLLDVL
jgi:hypothetical protein